MQEAPPFVSIIIPVKNEERVLGRCLESIRNLDYPADRLEVIVADSLSTDSSLHVAARYGARVVSNPKQTVVSGRNRGLEAAAGEFVAFTDADCEVSPGWLKAGLDVFQLEGVAGVGGATLFPDNATAFQKAVNVLFLLAGSIGSTAHRQSVRSVRYVSDIPGCNAIYRRSALERVMPLDEHLLTGEDAWLNWLLRQRGFRQAVSDNMILWHHRRSTPRSFFHQMYRFAIGRLQVGRRERSLLKPIHVLAGFSLPLVAGALILALAAGCSGIWIGLMLVACAGSLLFGIVKTRSLKAACYVPIVFMIFLVAWSLGFLRELLVPLKEVDGR
jgi:cellulose synthase/poly-beta-1,6-N-acetylglucosamine synthase-like glycosyltransferase